MDDQVLEIDFQPQPRAAGDIRRAAGSWLHERGFPAAGLDDLLLVVSELVTNAVVHARTAAHFGLRWDGRRATVEVTDGNGRPPALPAEAPAIGGRGLFLVDRLTTAWGSDARPSGKTVWATIETGP